MSGEQEPLRALLRPLTAATWQDAKHQDRLRRQIEQEPRRRSRWAWMASAVAAVALASVLLAATGSTRLLLRLFGIEVVEVERNADGDIEQILVRTDDAQLVLRPLPADHEFTEPVIVALPRRGGGELRVRVVRNGELDVLPLYVPVASGPEVAPGARYAMRQVPCPWSVSVTPDELALHRDGEVRAIVLPRLSTAEGALPRYGDARGVLEVLDS